MSYVVLRPALEETIARAQTRGPESLRDEGAISHMYAAFADLGPLEHHAVDTTDQSAAATAATVRRGVAAGTYRLA